MPQIKANGLNLEYDTRGRPEDETILLICGLGTQMTRWHEDFVSGFVNRGYRVVMFDNRDIGLSEKFDAAGPPNMAAIVTSLQAGETPPSAYYLDDMAADAAGLLEALHIEAAHIVGTSMGGMIAQLVATNHPERTRSLTSIMSTTGNPALPRATPEAMAVLNTPAPDPRTHREAYLAHAVRNAGVIGSPAYPAPEADVRARADRDVERSYYPIGFSRQYAAIMASPDRRPKLAGLTVPSLVIHGEADPLVPLAGGRDTAAAIPGADLLVIPGMGHDLPPQLFAAIVDAVVGITQSPSRQQAAQ